MEAASPRAGRREIVRQLAEQISRCDGKPRPACRIGIPSLDSLFEPRPLPGGCLLEWLSAGPASGASTLALLVARQACRRGGLLAVVDRRRRFYPPAAVSWGIAPSNQLVVLPRDRQEELWALEQLLRAPPIGAVMAWPERLDAVAWRRLQLAAESREVWGMLIRPATARDARCWAEARLLVTSQAAGLSRTTNPHRAATKKAAAEQDAGWRLRVELVRRRGGCAGRKIELEIDEATGTIREASSLHLAARLADSTPHRRQTGA